MTAGRVLHQDTIWCGRVICVESLNVTACASDGRTWASPVCMATRPVQGDSKTIWWNHEVLVTPEARDRLTSTELLHHLGGYSDEGDTWQTQEYQFSEEMERFWDQLVGPDESLRRRILEPFETMTGWTKATILPDGTVTLQLTDGTETIIRPSSPESQS
jgi:hypothetical protein